MRASPPLFTHHSSLITSIPLVLIGAVRECHTSHSPWIAPHMPENILVVEYEPRYTDRVRQALTGQPYAPAFARDGEEALRALSSDAPKLIVLSSVVPKISTTELIRAIRNQGKLAETPILLTVSGYNGNSPKADPQR